MFQHLVDGNYWEPRARRKWEKCAIERYDFDWKKLYLDENRLSYEGKFEWTIENFSKIDERRICSDRFEIGGFPWQLLLFPRGNHDPTCLAFYLKPGEDVQEYPMRQAKITFTVVNQRDRNKSRTRRCEHFFDRGEPDWGFTSFMRFTELNDKDNGFLEGDRMLLHAEVCVVPFRAPEALDPDDEATVLEVAEEACMPVAVARRAYIATRKNENVHSRSRSRIAALKLLATEPQKYLTEQGEEGASNEQAQNDHRSETDSEMSAESDDEDAAPVVAPVPAVAAPVVPTVPAVPAPRGQQPAAARKR